MWCAAVLRLVRICSTYALARAPSRSPLSPAGPDRVRCRWVCLFRCIPPAASAHKWMAIVLFIHGSSVCSYAATANKHFVAGKYKTKINRNENRTCALCAPYTVWLRRTRVMKCTCSAINNVCVCVYASTFRFGHRNKRNEDCNQRYITKQSHLKTITLARTIFDQYFRTSLLTFDAFDRSACGHVLCN